MSELPGEDLPQASKDDGENGKRKTSTEKPMSKRGNLKVRRNTKVDARVKLERSRQSARECRARKKLRYQYLEELVSNREKAVLALRDEVETCRTWCQEVDAGQVPENMCRKLSEADGANSPSMTPTSHDSE